LETKQVHFRVEQPLWDAFHRIFPYKGEPSAFFKRCMLAAIAHNQKKIDESMINTIVKEVNQR